MTEPQATQLAVEYRREFRDSEAFEAAWNALYELKTAITEPLARRFLGEELLKFRTRRAGLAAAEFLSSEPPPTPRPEQPFECPGCKRTMLEWQRDGHADWCPHVGCYALEVRSRIAIERRNAAREKQRRMDREALAARVPEAAPEPAGAAV